jgi:hypothetical protein
MPILHFLPSRISKFSGGFSFLWNEILVFIFYISFICKGWPFN